MSWFPSAEQLCSWGECPGQDEGAGKRRSGKTRQDNWYLRGTLVQAVLAATRSDGPALQARYHGVKRHRGHKAVVAVGHHIFEVAYYVMRDGRSYHELGTDYFDKRHAERDVRRHVQQLEALGFQVTIEKTARAADTFSEHTGCFRVFGAKLLTDCSRPVIGTAAISLGR
jgi:transposase